LQDSVGLLSVDERGRAARFHFADDRRRFTIARATLRRTLAASLGIDDPALLKFDYGQHGKPVLSPRFNHGALSFNASHSGERLLIGLGQGVDIGVDIECHRSLVDRDGLVRRYFSAAENDAYFRLPDEAREQAFFSCWTRKEAFVKALGRGLSFPLKSFDVGFSEGLDGLLSLQDEPAAPENWHLEGFEPEPGYSAAFATQGRFSAMNPVGQL
jgi:4'-phosphopantetheinyl transferase